MAIAYASLAVLTSLMAGLSGMMKLRSDPRVVHIIHEVVGVPRRFFSLLAACEFAGGAGLLIGIIWPPVGLAAAIGLVLYFIGAIIGHVRVGDFQGLGPATFMLCVSVACAVLRMLAK